MSTNKSINLSYNYFKEVDYKQFHFTIFAPYANVERKYIIEYKVPKVDVLDESPAEYISALIQLTDSGYDILNIYVKGRNHQSHSYTWPFKIIFNHAVEYLEA